MRVALYRCVMYMVLMAALSFSSTTALLAKDLANLPPEAVDGWKRLAEQSKTFCILISSVDGTGKNLFNPGVLSRLDDRYMKYERLGAESKESDWPDQITEVLLYDGSEYFTILKDKPARPFALAKVGNDRVVHTLLKVAAAPSASLRFVDLLQAVNSQTETFTKFERRDGKDEGVYVTLSVNNPNVIGSFEVVAKLDPQHDYRVISAIQTSASSPYSRQRIEYRYDEHPALASEELVHLESLDRLSQDWVSANPQLPYATNTRQHLLKDVKLTAGQFSLAHYGLPPFRKRHQSIWPMVAICVGILVAISGVIHVWRRPYATA